MGSQYDDPSQHDLPVPSEAPERRLSSTVCQVHEVTHDPRILPVRTYGIEVRNEQGGRIWLKRIELTVCDQVATQLGLLPLP